MFAQDTPFIYHPELEGYALELRVVYEWYILGNHSLSITYNILYMYIHLPTFAENYRQFSTIKVKGQIIGRADF